MSFLEPNTHLFSFNNPYGACPTCEGYGNVVGIDEELVIPNTGLSIFEDCIFPFKTPSYFHYKEDLISCLSILIFQFINPGLSLLQTQQELVWNGNKSFNGIQHLFTVLEEKSYKIQNRVMLSRYRGKTKCTSLQWKTIAARNRFCENK